MGGATPSSVPVPSRELPGAFGCLEPLRPCPCLEELM